MVYTLPMRFYHGHLVREDIWREGEYLDLWSVPHFLSGLSLGLALLLLGFDTLSAVLIAFVLLCAYELFEYVAKIEEGRANAIVDIVVGMGSCVLALLFAPQFAHEHVLTLLVVALVADAILSFFGWRESQKAAALEMRLRAEWKKERARMHERRRKLSSRFGPRKPLT